ncbi:MAG: DUF885 domain-containing protein [Gammaproteobacteria bacterium]|nr:DUF885 domain-containing protein [Gammaproteobacteria bacterium]
MRKEATCIACVAGLLALLFPGPETAASDRANDFDAFVERYLEYRWRTDPEAATRSGVHRYDSILARMSKEDFSARSATLGEFLDETFAFDSKALSHDQQIDLQLVRSDIRVRREDIDRIRDWQRKPTMYIPFGGLNDLVNGEFATEQERARALLARLQQVPRVLGEGRDNLERPPRLFTETAIRTARQMIPFYEHAIPNFAERSGYRVSEFRAAAQMAKAALLDYLEFLEDDLLPRSNGAIAIGKESYNYLLRELHMLDDDSDSLLKKGELYFREIEQLLDDTASEIDPDKSWQEITEDIRADHPSADGLLEAYCDEIQRSRSHVIEQGLVTVPPNEEVRCLDTPPSQRAFSPFGTFRQPPPFSDSKVGYLILHPIDPDLSTDATEKLLRAHDYTWISVIAPHEAYPGHHLQALKAQENPRVFRRVYSAPIFSEGWGLYTEELMYETGFFRDPQLTRLTQLRLRLWRAARIILDTKLHTGQMSYDEARQFLVDNVGFEESSTAGEVNIYVFRPSYAIAYVVGFGQIMKLRDDYRRRKGAAFNLREFHDRLLTLGSMPIPLARQLLLPE